MPKIKTDKSGPGSNIRAEREYAKSIGVKSPTRLNKEQLDEALRQRELELGLTREKHSVYDFTAEERKTLEAGLRGKHRAYQMVSGYFHAFAEGDGVLRRDPFDVLPEADIYVPSSLVSKCDMREGDRITGNVAVLFYNKVRVLKSVRYVDGDAMVRSPLRTDFRNLSADKASRRLDIHGNHSMTAIIDRVIALGMGESLVISGMCADNADYFDEAAAAVSKGLCAGFDGVVYGVFGADGRRLLGASYNPETTITGGGEDACAFMREMIKRTAERGENSVVVIRSDETDVRPFLSMARAYGDSSITVIAFTVSDYVADAHITFDGAEINCAETGNSLASYICGMTRARLMSRALGRIERAEPDELLVKFTEYVNERD